MTDFSNATIVELAAIVANHLNRHGIRTVLVGGLAVEIYSENIYLTHDIDMVDVSYHPPTELRQAMEKIGFHKQGRVFVNETTEITVEFPAGPITVGDEIVTGTTTARTTAGDIPILKPGDVIKDRLAAYFHWQDGSSLVQALAVLVRFPEELAAIEDFCRSEGAAESVDLIQQMLKAAGEHDVTTMAGLEKLVVDRVLRDL